MKYHLLIYLPIRSVATPSYAYFSIPIPRNKFFHHTVSTASNILLPKDVLFILEALIDHPLCTFVY